MISLGAALAVTVAAGVALRFLPPAHPGGAPLLRTAPITIVPLADHLGCPVDVAWSPDGKKVAVLGYTACQSGFAPSGTNPGRVNIYSATTGQLIQQFAPDQSIMQTTHINLPPPLSPSPNSSAGQPVAPYFRYQALLWSPDGNELAMPFFIESYMHIESPPFIPESGATVPPNNTFAGVLITDTTGTNPRVITADYHETTRFTSLEWSLASRSLLTAALNVAPALGYQWGANGQLLPQTPLNASAPAPASSAGPIGNPDGGTSFSIWQPGEAAPAYAQPGGNGTLIQSVPDVYEWYTAFAAWSPDGQYLITPAYVGGRVVVPQRPAPSASALTLGRVAGAAHLTERDAALGTLYGALAAETSVAASSTSSARFVAWRPDGRVAAATVEPYYSQTVSLTALSHPTVALYDSATGRQLVTLAPKTALADTLINLLSMQPVWLKWSPDGRHLLLLDLAIGTLTIWGPGTLPR